MAASSFNQVEESTGTLSPNQNQEEEQKMMYSNPHHTVITGFSTAPSPAPMSRLLVNSLQRYKFILLLFALTGTALLWLALRDSSTDTQLWRSRPDYGQYLSQGSYLKYSAESNQYQFAIISDMDTSSKIGDSLVFKADIKEGRLIRQNSKYTVEWDREYTIKAEYNEKGRGMELSELVYYNGKLLTCDDRTGIIYEISRELKIAIPRWIMVAGDGRSTSKGHKCEWMTVKDDMLYVGSIGKEFVRNGEIASYDNTWVKVMDRVGGVTHVDWRPIYDKLRTFTGTEYPGYLVHEAIGWSNQMKKWVFLPRRLSKEAYDEKLDERKGNNLVLTSDEDLTNIKQQSIGQLVETHGFSSFKFLPFRENEIVALKSEENGNSIKSFMMVFDINNGEILMNEIEVSATTKFEGVEIL